MSPLACKTAEFIPGYVLRERIGAGGYGEVWKVEAPGGLLKAVKFVYGCLDEERAARELKALTRIREVRHPFILSLERIEVLDGQLVVVTELADGSLRDRYDECRAAGRAGIPREELLDYLRDAADALDYMSEHHSLQHLDVKPENLLRVGGRVKVADFGLVKDVQDPTVSLMGGLTPVYAAPEVFDGRPSLRSDQYSLAIVYEELLSGMLPFPGQTPAQLATQHLHGNPRLSHLPSGDRPVLARALAKDPGDRFPSCRALVDALREQANRTSGSPPAGVGAAAASDRDTASATPSQETVQPSRERPASPAPPTPRASAVCTVPLEALAASPGFDTDSVEEAAWARPASAAADHQDDWPLQAVSAPAPTEDLPPLESDDAASGLRPVLVLGIGGAAALVLRQLRQRWSDRFPGPAPVPALQMLLVDTDPETVADALSGGPASALDSSQTLLAPLRKPEEYHDALEHHKRWLSRRWLCNLPRSQRTEGLRPLGRLALVDHFQEVRARLRAAIAHIVSADALDASVEQGGPLLRSKVPSVILLASLSGGTGSGMVLDLAYAVREALRDLSLPEAGLEGVLLHWTPRQSNEKLLATLNACACLRELRRYSRDAGYPGDPLFGLPAFGPDVPPFDSTYLVHLGDELGEEELYRASGDVADYLDLWTASPAGAVFEKCRAALHDPNASKAEPTVRSFVLCRLSRSRADIASAAMETICRGVAERWHGTPRAGRQMPAGQPGDAERDQQEFDRSLREIRGAIDDELGGDAEQILVQSLLSSLAQQGPEGAVEGLPTEIEAVTRVSNECLAHLFPHPSPRSRIQKASNPSSLMRRIEQLASGWANSLREACLMGLSRPGAGSLTARSTARWLAERLSILKARLEERQGRQQDRFTEAIRLLVSAAAPRPAGARRWLSLLGRKKPVQDDAWMRYARARIEQEVLHAAGRFLQLLEPKLTDLVRRSKGFGEELDALAALFLADLSGPRPTLGASSDCLAGGDELAATVADLFRDRLSGLIVELDQQWRAELLAAPEGPIAATAQPEHQRQESIDRWRREARRRALVILRDGDDTGWLPSLAGELQNAPATVRRCAERAAPLCAGGGRRRAIAICPAESLRGLLQAAVAEATGLSPSVIVDRCSDPIFCYEMEGLPLSFMAARLIDDRRDYAQLAGRLHTRLDVAW